MDSNKRLLLATLLCFGLLVGWQYLAQYMGWIPEPVAVEETAPAPQAAAPAPLPDAAPPAPRFAPSEGREVRVDTPLYTAVLHSGGGVLQSFALKKYAAGVEDNSPPFNMVSPDAAAQTPMGLLLNGQPSWNVGDWGFSGDDLSLAAGKTGTLTFEGEVNGIRITRTLTFHADTYLIDESVTLAAQNTATLVRLTSMLAASPFASDSSFDPMGMAWVLDGSLKRENSDKELRNEGIMTSGPINWAGMMSNYFLSAIIPAKDTNSVFKGRIVGHVWRAGVETADISLVPGTPVTVENGWWLGPKDRDLLQAAHLGNAIDMGMFTILALPLLWLLSFFQSIVVNWGVAIILLTVLIKALFWPLMRKSYKSMEQMKKLQPMMAQLQEKYGKNKEELGRETMRLYKTYGVNPASGCLPLLVQLPVFVALYQALLHSIELRHASFISHLPFTDIVWLADLSAKDPFYITPVLMCATMFLQQWLAPAMGDPTQRKVMMLMPLIFGVMCINFPSGLVLYWTCSNILAIVQQSWTLRRA